MSPQTLVSRATTCAQVNLEPWSKHLHLAAVQGTLLYLDGSDWQMKGGQLECKSTPTHSDTNVIYANHWLVFLRLNHCFCVIAVHPKKKNRQTCVRKSLICAFAMAFIISVMLIAANQMLRNGME